MVLQLNPRFPLVWRSPSSLQFGVESPPVRLDDVSSAQEQVIAALASGATRPGIELIAATAHVGEAELAALLETLEPVLAKTPPPPTARVAVIGTTPTAARIRSSVAAVGLTLVPPDGHAELGILVSHYVVEPELFGYWLSRDVPHLPIVFSDTGVHIGPVIEPGRGPCLYCLERHRTDADPARPAIATQLWGRTSPIETPLVIAEVTALGMRMSMRRIAGIPAAVATSVFLDAASGQLTHHEWVQHPDCGCAALPENGSAPGRRSAPARTAPTTGAALSVPA